MQTAILKCYPGSQFHFGKLGLDENMSLDDTSDYIHSDTLFSAIINEHNKLFDNKSKTDAFVEAFRNQDIKISSAFYALNVMDKPTIYFFPRPVTATFLVKTEDVKLQIKKIKKIKFVSAKILKDGISPDKWLNSQECTVIQDYFLCAKDELNDLIVNQIDNIKIFSYNHETKVRVHTPVKGDTLYNQANIQIVDNRIEGLSVDFFFLFEIKNKEKYEKTFKKIIHSLTYSGIGGQRSTGTGIFEEAIFLDNDFDLQSSINMNISLTIPENGKLSNFKYYDLITRGGRVVGKNEENSKISMRLNRIKMVKEGGIITKSEEGKCVNLEPKELKKPFVRNGIAFSIGIHNNFDYNE